ncbi:MAG: peptide-methionine (R)-S-oxide reductase MsrB [Candidatus Omnitrophota bacterium]
MSKDLNEFKSGKVNVFNVEQGKIVETEMVFKPEEEWQKILSAQEFKIAFKQGTERPFSGRWNANKKKGVYRSKISGNDLFHSDNKFDSGTGWPSFYQPVDEKNIILKEDNTLFMKRVEVLDRVSGAHLGHVFNDGPPPTGLRYCINSDALDFVEGVGYKDPPKGE